MFRKYLLSLLLPNILCWASANSQADTLEPTYTFRNPTCSGCVFNTIADAYSYETKRVTNLVFLGYRAQASSGYLNGRPRVYEYQFKFVNVNDGDGGWTTLASIHEECPAGTAAINKFNFVGTIPDILVTCGYAGPGPQPPAPAVPPDAPAGPTCTPTAGNPIYLSTGFKKQDEIDYNGVDGLKFVRTYRSDKNGWVSNHSRTVTALPAFSSSHGAFDALAKMATPKCRIGVNLNGEAVCNNLLPDAIGNGSSPGIFLLERASGRTVDLGNGVDVTPALDVNDRLAKILDSNDSVIKWTVYNAAEDATETYNSSGQIVRINYRSGKFNTYAYSDSNTPTTTAPRAGLLLSVTNHFGRKLQFTYNPSERISSMIDPSGGTYLYAYDESSSLGSGTNKPMGNLTSVTYPGGNKRIYWYNEPEHTSGTNLPFALTGITDENGARFATWEYDSTGRGISSEHANGVEKYSVAYPEANVKTVVTDPLGTARSYNFTTVLGVVKSAGQDQPAGAGCSAASSLLTYDQNGNVATSTDFKGNRTEYSYDLTRNLETSRKSAVGTVVQRFKTTSWHPSYRLPQIVAEPLRMTTFSYFNNGDLSSRTVQATTDITGAAGLKAVAVGTPQIWTYTYNGLGQMRTVTGPRKDVSDVTTYTYLTNGDLETITNAASQLTKFADYDLNGRVGTITEPNGGITSFTYWPRGWLKSHKVSAGGQSELTSYDYDNIGQLKTVTFPDGSKIGYTYDDAHRLTNVSDILGNSITYTPDNMSNRVSEQVKDPTGKLTRQITRVIDVLNRVEKITGAQ